MDLGRPTEIERKFLAEMPSADWLESRPGHTERHIVQTYVIDGRPGETRVRQIGEGGQVRFVRTHKEGTGIARIEEEEDISEAEAMRLLERADAARSPVEKIRHVIPSGGHDIEIDVYPWDGSHCVFEIELASEDEEYLIPEGLRPIAEVTEFSEFKNGSLAKGIPEDGLLGLYRRIAGTSPLTN